MFCTTCGFYLSNTQGTFCPSCGAKRAEKTVEVIRGSTAAETITVKAKHIAVNLNGKKKRGKMSTIVAICVIVVTVAVAVGLLLNMGDGEDVPDDTSLVASAFSPDPVSIPASAPVLPPPLTPEIEQPTTPPDIDIAKITLPYYGEISAYGKRVAEEFLMQLHTIFADGNQYDEFSRSGLLKGEERFAAMPSLTQLEDGRFFLGRERNAEWDWYYGWPMITSYEPKFALGIRGVEVYNELGHSIVVESIFSYEVPDIFIRHYFNDPDRTGFYNRNGNRITDAPWMLGSMYATGFSLWDLNNDGIPEIIVYYWGNYIGTGDFGAPRVLFKYIDGAYRRIYNHHSQIWDWHDNEPTHVWFPWDEYLIDSTGNLIGYHIGHGENPIYVSISFIIDEGAGLADKVVLARGTLDWENWGNWEFFWERYPFIGESDFLAPAHMPWGVQEYSVTRTIPGTDEKLTLVERFRELEQEVTESVRRRLS